MSVHPLFIVFLIGAFLTGVGGFALALVIAVLVHEASHAFISARYGVHTKKLRLLPFGAQIEIDVNFLPRREKINIYLAGPIGNAIFAVFLSSILWIIPESFEIVEVLLIANIVPAIVNLLPIYPLDGGKILMILCNKKWMQNVVTLFSILVFATVTIYGIFTGFSLAWITLGTMMIITICLDNANIAYGAKFGGSVTKQGRTIEIAVHSDETLYSLYKKIAKRCFTKFIIIDMGNKTLYENELEILILKFDAGSRIGDVISDVRSDGILRPRL